MALTWIERAPSLHIAALCLVPSLAISAASAQDVGTPPPATNLQPQILGPTSVNPTPPAPSANEVPEGDFFTLGKPLAGIGGKLANAGAFPRA